MILGRPVIFLHVGAMKTGTTFLQKLFEANREHLLDAGVLAITNHTEPPITTSEILNGSAWPELVDRMLDSPGCSAVFSMESLSFANQDQAAGLVSLLEAAEVHVIVTVRDATRALPSQWQTHVRSGGTIPWPKFATDVSQLLRTEAGEQRRGARIFLRTQGIPRMLEAWGSTVPAGRLHVLTVPPAGSDPWLLWQRFAHIIGVDPAVCSVPPMTTKPSLGYPSAELMRRLNASLGKIPKHEYRHTLKVGVGLDILPQRAALERPAQLDEATAQFAVSWNGHVRSAIRASGAHVVGDLDELPAHLSAEVRNGLVTRLRRPGDDEILAAADTTEEGLHQLIRSRASLLEAEGGDPNPIAHTIGRTVHPRDQQVDGERSVHLVVEELAALARVAIDLQSALERVPHDPPNT